MYISTREFKTGKIYFDKKYKVSAKTYCLDLDTFKLSRSLKSLSDIKDSIKEEPVKENTLNQWNNIEYYFVKELSSFYSHVYILYSHNLNTDKVQIMQFFSYTSFTNEFYDIVRMSEYIFGDNEIGEIYDVDEIVIFDY